MPLKQIFNRLTVYYTVCQQLSSLRVEVKIENRTGYTASKHNLHFSRKLAGFLRFSLETGNRSLYMYDDDLPGSGHWEIERGRAQTCTVYAEAHNFSFSVHRRDASKGRARCRSLFKI